MFLWAVTCWALLALLRADEDLERPGRSFRMIQSFMGEKDSSICPDRSLCPAEYTCLSTFSGYSCCPLAQGVSCPDGTHCCPEGHHCSADGRSCIQEENVSVVLCGDKQTECPDKTTCCQTPDGDWGCCPIEKAICCADKIHCCPEGTTCDIEHSKCISQASGEETPARIKLPGKTTRRRTPERETERDKIVKCNQTAACQDNFTCCRNAEQGWGCCPLPQAVCCEGGTFCCPAGTTCDPASESCIDTHTLPPIRSETPILWEGAAVGDILCDSRHSCPDRYTCCKDSAGNWDCCPFTKAVCCDDGQHCCPEDTICDLTTLYCKSPSGSTAMKKKRPAVAAGALTLITERAEDREDEGRVRCDTCNVCPQDKTCCLNPSTEFWNCCSLQGPGKDNYCPQGSDCSSARDVCAPAVALRMANMPDGPLLRYLPTERETIQCEDKSTCKDGETCCKTSVTEWGCCPVPNAVCCSDMKHCCFSGYICVDGGCRQSRGPLRHRWHSLYTSRREYL